MNTTETKETTSTDARAQLPRLSYTGPYKKAIDIAGAYGFTLIKEPKVSKEDVEYAKKFNYTPEGDEKNEPILSLTERIALIRLYSEENWETLPHPVLVAYTKKHTPRGERSLTLAALGSEKSITDNMVLHVASTILNALSKKERVLEVNSIGDKESGAQFLRDLQAYFRKHINSLPSECRESFKNDITNILTEHHEKCTMFQRDAPRSITFLSDSSRRHFKEMLEYIESREKEYVVEDGLVASPDVFSEVLTKIVSKDGCVLARGGRSNTLTRGTGMRKTVPLTAVSLLLEKHTARESIAKSTRKKKTPESYIIALGDSARLLGFSLADQLQKAHVTFSLPIGKEQLGGQLDYASRSGIPFALIIGQKEALDGTTIVRNLETRSQEVMPLEDVADYLVKARKKK